MGALDHIMLKWQQLAIYLIFIKYIWMIFFTLATLSMILVNPSKCSFSFCGFVVPLLQIHLGQILTQLSFGRKKVTEIPLRTCISE